MKPNLFDFRIRIKDEKRHIYAKDLRLEVMENGFLNTQKNPLALFATDEIEMWSGYVDSTGKRIYEKDIVEVNNEEMDMSFKGVVKFCKDSKTYEVESHALAEIFDFKFEVEVVGYEE